VIDVKIYLRFANCFSMSIVQPMLCLLTVRLAGSGLTHEGRLEVYYDDTWGTVCDDYFDDKDATVACKSLFGSGSVLAMLYYCSHFYSVEARILII